MSWSSSFSQPYILDNGQILFGLTDAAVLIGTLPARRQASAHWMYAVELMLIAREKPSTGALAGLHAQLYRALRADGLITIRSTQKGAGLLKLTTVYFSAT
jgi:hypothetical protein